MHFEFAASTDIGIVKKVNQDSILIEHGLIDGSEILFACICDGMGGLKKGELVSACVIRRLRKWFRDGFLPSFNSFSTDFVSRQIVFILNGLNSYIAKSSTEKFDGEAMGTTVTCLLMYKDEYVIVHVGDTRVYEITSSVLQLTHDHTFIQREIDNGNMTPKQAKTDKRRNLLLQCVGASAQINPQILTGKVKVGTYLLCSDGFRHVISDDEIYKYLNSKSLLDKDIMKKNLDSLIDIIKERGERDNISACVIKAS